jgi:hypothetical protein
MERKALESAGAHYLALRGLFGIPLGLIFVCSGLGNLAWGPFRHLWVFWAALGIAGLSGLAIMGYYRRRYGRVTQTARDQAKAAALTALGALLITGGIMLDWRAGLPIDTTVATFGAMMLGYYAATVGLKLHHALIWGGLIVAGLLPVWGDVSRDSKINGGLIVMGIATAVAGLFDHLTLERTFAAAPATEEKHVP